MRIKNGLVVGIILLFVGVAVQPSLATVQPEYFDVTTEFIGLGKEYTTKLTKEQIDELDVLFDSIGERLNKSVSREETIEIFKDAVIKLDSFGLLGDIGIQETENLVTGFYQNPKFMKTLERIYNREKGALSDDENIFCFLFGITSGLLIVSTIAYFITPLLLILGLIPDLGEPLLSLIFLFMIDIVFTFVPSFLIPFCLGRMVYFLDSAKGTIISFGLNGLKSWNGKLKAKLTNFSGYSPDIGIFGFTGLKIDTIAIPLEFFIGCAPRVHIEEE
jgi:hypothetical protein